jgi:hypothetical protein
LVAHATYTHISPNYEALPPVNYTIYNNFGTPAATNSWQAAGYFILGPGNFTGGTQQSVAIAFTPAAGSHAKKAEIPVQQYSLTDGSTYGFEASIQTDGGNIPSGTIVAGGGPKQETANTLFYTCCTAANTIIVNFGGAGASLAANTQYWLVVDANPVADNLTEVVWDFVGGPLTGINLALGGWSASEADTFTLAAKITGTKP